MAGLCRVERKSFRNKNVPKIASFAFHNSGQDQGVGNEREAFDKPVMGSSDEARSTTLKREFAADLLQMAEAVTRDAIVDCGEWRVGAPLGAPDRMDPPGAI
jgi:hypothetical protein